MNIIKARVKYPRSYRGGGYTFTPRVSTDGIRVKVSDGKTTFTRFFPKVGATLASAHDTARNMALNPVKVPVVEFMRVRGGLRGQVWGVDMACRINRDFKHHTPSD